MYALVLAGLVLGSLLAGRQSGPAGLLVPVLGTGAMMLLPAAAAGALMVYCGVSARRRDDGTSTRGFWALSSVYPRATSIINALHIASYGISLHFLGWGTVPEKVHVGDWGLPRGALIAAPFLASLVLAWIPLHYAETHIRRWGPTLGQQLSFNVRNYILTLCVPMAVALGAVDAVKFLPAPVAAVFDNPVMGAVAAGALIVGGYALAPMLLVRLWKTSRLPECHLRERLTDLCRRIGVTFRDIRIWETPGLQFLNAAVMGIAGRVRYIVVSRPLIEAMSPEQVEAVFAHELGHAKRHHITYYLVFAADFVLLARLAEVAANAPMLWSEAQYTAIAAAALVLYWGVGFGYLSRAFERESDLFGAQTMGDTALFASALEMIAHFNGISPAARSWRHGSILSRVEFLRAAGSGGAGSAFLERVTFLKIFLIALGAVTLAALGAALARGW